MRGTIHHIDLSVRDPDASRAFYESVLGFMGYAVTKPDNTGNPGDTAYEFAIPAPAGGYHISIGLVRARADAPAHNRFNPGMHHLAFRADSRADVDAFYVHLQRLRAHILDAPTEYPQYSPGYYAVFFADPDGIKLEFVFKP